MQKQHNGHHMIFLFFIRRATPRFDSSSNKQDNSQTGAGAVTDLPLDMKMAESIHLE